MFMCFIYAVCTTLALYLFSNVLQQKMELFCAVPFLFAYIVNVVFRAWPGRTVDSYPAADTAPRHFVNNKKSLASCGDMV